MNSKALTNVEVKDADQGVVRAVFARYNEKDLDGDVTLPGAFEDGAQVKISAYGHASWGQTLPVGKGVIRTTDTEAILDGQFFMKNPDARATFEVVKEMGDLQEWSYGYETLASSLGELDGEQVTFLEKQKVFEVSPVLAGAGLSTGTVSVKEMLDDVGVGLKAAIPYRKTQTTDAAWDGPAMKARLRNDGNAVYYRVAFAWVDPEADPETKAAYKFIHHMVDGDGNIGAANVGGCVTGIAVLNGGRGGTTIPDSDRQGVYNHLAGHLRDAGMEPPTLKAKQLSFTDEVGHALGSVQALVYRTQALGSLRAEGTKEGRILSAANRDRLMGLHQTLSEMVAQIEKLIAESDPQKDEKTLMREAIRFELLRSAI